MVSLLQHKGEGRSNGRHFSCRDSDSRVTLMNHSVALMAH
jgi:hypothetical protein